MAFDAQIEEYLQGLNINRNEFSTQEKLVLNKIINQIEKSGSSSLLRSLYEQDYDEIPVSMKQFILDSNYIGNSTNNGDSIWDSWKETLYNLFNPNNKYTLVLISGAIGTGKSTIVCVALSYIAYKLLCLKDPASYYNIMPGSKPGIALFNITLSKGEGVAFYKLNSIFRSSPWFLAHGEEVGNNSNRKIFLPDKNITVAVGSQADHFIGLDTFSCFMDEISFVDNKEIQLTKMKAYDSFNAINRRMESRFMDEGQIPGMSFLVSSAKHEDDFISQIKDREGNKPNVKIIEKPLWEAVPKERYCGKTFNLVVGNRSTDAFIVDDTEYDTYTTNDDFDTYKVPIEHLDAFKSDINGAIRDILGKPQKVSSRFLQPDKITGSINPTFKNIFSQTLIKLGFRDGSSLMDYIKLDSINTKLIKYPIFVHHDLALSGDNAGIFGYAVANNVLDDSQDDGNYNTWRFLPVFWCKLAPDKKGSQIPLYKIREAIQKLRDDFGFNIMGVSADGYQSADMLQQYSLLNFNTFLNSMDKAPSNGYMFFRSSLYTNKIILPDDPYLKHELTHLIENKALEKIDHEAGGEKDLSDGCAGSIYCSILYDKKSKVKLFSNGNFLYTDIIGTYSNITSNRLNIENDTNQALKELGKGLFNEIDDNDSDIFSIY